MPIYFWRFCFSVILLPVDKILTKVWNGVLELLERHQSIELSCFSFEHDAVPILLMNPFRLNTNWKLSNTSKLSSHGNVYSAIIHTDCVSLYSNISLDFVSKVATIVPLVHPSYPQLWFYRSYYAGLEISSLHGSKLCCSGHDVQWRHSAFSIASS